MREESRSTHRQMLLRSGAAYLIAGSVLVMVFRTLHGDLPTDTGEAALSYVVAHPLYPLVHLGDILGFFGYTGGLVALSASLTIGDARAIGRLGMVSVLLGAAIHIVDFSADGFSLPMLANVWAVAPASDRVSLELGARVALVIIGGPSVIALLFAWGSTLALYGLAIRQEGYSRWLGWTGIVLGAMIFVLGLIFFLKPNIFPGFLFYGLGGLAAHLWTIFLGVAMWRRGGAVA